MKAMYPWPSVFMDTKETPYPGVRKRIRTDPSRIRYPGKGPTAPNVKLFLRSMLESEACKRPALTVESQKILPNLMSVKPRATDLHPPAGCA